MGLKVLALTLIFICSMLSASVTGAFFPSGFDYRKIDVKQGAFGQQTDYLGDFYGHMRYLQIINTGTEDLNCSLYDDASTLIMTKDVAKSSSYTNRSMINESVLGTATLTCNSAALNSTSINGSALVSAFKLNEGTGNTTSDFKGANTLELLYNNGTDYIPLGNWTTSGLIYNATTPASAGGFLRVNESATTLNFTNTTGGFSISLAHKLVIPPSGYTYPIFHQGAVNGNATRATNASSAYVDSSGYVNFTVKLGSTGSTSILYNASALAGAWNTYDFNFNGTQMSIRINGTNVVNNSFAMTGINSSSMAWVFGDGYIVANNSVYYPGASWDEIYLFNQSLSTTQAGYLHNLSATGLRAQVKTIAFRD